MAATNRTDRGTRSTAGPVSSTGEASAPLRSLMAVGLTAGLYGLLLLMTVMYQWSLGGLGGTAP